MAGLRVLLVGGGSTGHLAPLVAVWREIAKEQPEAQVFALATDRGNDHSFLESEGIPHAITRYPWRTVLLPWSLLVGFVASMRSIQSFQPDVIFSKGGLVSVPMALAAALRRVPVVVHESDAILGGGTSLVGTLATAVCLGIDTGRHDAKTTVTGNPVRPEIVSGSRAQGLAKAGLSGQKPVLFVTGGSQGAEALNRALIDGLPKLLQHFEIIHLTGPKKSAGAAQAGYYAAEHSGGSMGDFYAAASLALIRGGAGSISECASTGVPAVVVPLEGLAKDHQVHNAKRAAQSGGCVMLRQSKLETELVPTLIALANDQARLKAMSAAVRTLQEPNAARVIAMIILKAASAQ